MNKKNNNKEVSGVNGREELKILAIALLVLMLFMAILLLLRHINTRLKEKNNAIKYNICYTYLNNIKHL